MSKLAVLTGTAGAACASYFFLGPGSKEIKKKPLPPSAAKAADMLPPALEAAAKKNKVAVRATLFNRELEEMYAYNMDGTPTLFQKIAQAKAYSCITLGADALLDPGVPELMTIMVPWMLGASQHVNVQGALPVQLPGAELACFVVNGAPAASTDKAINEEVLTACGFGKDDRGVWVLPGK